MAESFGGIFGAALGGSAIGAAIVKLTVDTREYQAQLAKAKGETEASMSGMSGSVSKFSAYTKAAMIASAAMVVKFGIDSVRAYEEHQHAVIALQQVIANSPALVGASTRAFEEQAAALQNLTGYQDEEFLRADAVLGRFQLTEAQIKSLLPLVADYARATGQDVPTAANNLGRALLGNTRALKAIGIEFTATGNRTQDVATITAALQEKVGGLAQEYGRTLSGQLQIASARFDDLKEAVGKAIVPLLKDLVPALTGVVKLLTPLAHYLPEIAAAFLAWKAFSFAPTLLLNIAKGLEAVGAASLSESVLMTAAKVKLLGSAIFSASGALPPLAFGLATVAGATFLFTQAQRASNEQTGIWLEKLKESGMTLGEAKARLAAMEQALARGARGYSYQADALKAYIAELERSGQATDDTSAKTLALAAAQRKAAQDARDLKAAELSLSGGLLGLVGDLDTLRAAQDKVNQLKRQGKTDSAAYHDAVLAEAQAVVSFRSDLADYVSKLQDSGATQDDVRRKLIAMGRQFGLSRSDIVGLLGPLGQYLRMLQDIPNKVTTQVQTIYTSTGGGGHRQLASGGLIAGASGFIATAPTYLVGEGRYPTRFGTGAEAVLPLDDRTLSRLGKAMARYIQPQVQVVPVVFSDQIDSRIARQIRSGVVGTQMRRAQL